MIPKSRPVLYHTRFLMACVLLALLVTGQQYCICSCSLRCRPDRETDPYRCQDNRDANTRPDGDLHCTVRVPLPVPGDSKVGFCVYPVPGCAMRLYYQ